MVSARLVPMAVLLLLSGCLSFPGGHAQEGKHVSATPYVSRVDSRESSALYRFAEASLLFAEGEHKGAEESLLKAIEADPQSPDLRLTLSILYVNMGETEKAIRAAEDALIHDPDDPQGHFHLAGLYFSQERDAEASEHYRRVIELDPDREDAYINLGIASARMGDMERAVATMKALLQRRPDSILGELALARLYRELDLTFLAEESYLRVLKKHPGFDPVFLELADMYETSGKIEKALDLYRSGLETTKQRGFYLQQIVRLLIVLDRYDEAAAELSLLLAEDPNNLEALRRLGLIRLQEGEWAAAAEIFGDLRVRLPDSDQVLFYYGTALEGVGDFEGALQAFREVSPESELYPDTLSHLAYLYHQLRRPEEAILLLGQRLDDPSNPPEFFSYLASLHQTKGEYEEAHSVLDKGLLLHENDSDLIYRRAILHEQEGDGTRALEIMRALLEQEPENVEALNYIAYTYAERGTNLEEALVMAQKAIALKEEGHVFDTLGWVYFKLGRYEEARSAMESAAASLPEDAVVLEHLGDVYSALELFARARDAYEKARALDPDKSDIRLKIENLPE